MVYKVKKTYKPDEKLIETESYWTHANTCCTFGHVKSIIDIKYPYTPEKKRKENLSVWIEYFFWRLRVGIRIFKHCDLWHCFVWKYNIVKVQGKIYRSSNSLKRFDFNSSSLSSEFTSAFCLSVSSIAASSLLSSSSILNII